MNAAVGRETREPDGSSGADDHGHLEPDGSPVGTDANPIRETQALIAEVLKLDHRPDGSPGPENEQAVEAMATLWTGQMKYPAGRIRHGLLLAQLKATDRPLREKLALANGIIRSARPSEWDPAAEPEADKPKSPVVEERWYPPRDPDTVRRDQRWAALSPEEQAEERRRGAEIFRAGIAALEKPDTKPEWLREMEAMPI